MGYLSAFLSSAAAWRIFLCASSLDFLPAIKPGEDSPCVSGTHWSVDFIGVVRLGFSALARPLVETRSGRGTDCWNPEAALRKHRPALPCSQAQDRSCNTGTLSLNSARKRSHRIFSTPCRMLIASWSFELSVISRTNIPAEDAKLVLGRGIRLLRIVLPRLCLAGTRFNTTARRESADGREFRIG